jgi:hypothetical protein
VSVARDVEESLEEVDKSLSLMELTMTAEVPTLYGVELTCVERIANQSERIQFAR